jgi:subtilisin-like proprotein convertase family protein
MRSAGRLSGSCVLGVALLGGCAKGVEGDTGSLTFGPPQTTQGTATTSDPIDPTTGGETSPSASSSGVVDEGTATVAESTGPVDPPISTSTGPAGPVCGDGLAEDTEECDGADLAGLACPDVSPMFTGGTLACDGACAFDTAGCTTADNPIEVCQVVNTAISDLSTVTNTIVLAPGQLGGTITDVNVRVELDHTYLGDLAIDVTSGANVVLFDALCDGQDNLDATFDDQAGAAFSCPSSDVGLSFTPSFPLSAFNGGVVGSNWTLSVEDQLSGDSGSMQEWCVTIAWM